MTSRLEVSSGTFSRVKRISAKRVSRRTATVWAFGGIGNIAKITIKRIKIYGHSQFNQTITSNATLQPPYIYPFSMDKNSHIFNAPTNILVW
jgi:hypothetical protein